MSDSIKIKIINIDERNPLPSYKTEGAAGLDLYASLPNGVTQINLAPGEFTKIDAGIKVQVPDGYMLNIYARSGLASKYNLTLSNSVGVVDYGYLDPIGVLLSNHGNKTLVIRQGDRIAQAILMPIPLVEWEVVDTFADVFNRGGGFGSTKV